MADDALDQESHQIRGLSEMMRAFAEATSDYRRLLQVITRRMAKLFGDACAITLVSEDRRSMEPSASYCCDPLLAGEFERMLHGPRIDLDGTSLGARVVRTGNPERFDRLERGALAADIGPAYAELAERIAPRSILVLPLRSHDRAIGTLSLVRLKHDSEPFSPAEETVAVHLVEHAALALSNALLLRSLHRELEERRAAEEQSQQFVALIQHSSDFIAMAALDGRILFVNRAGRELLGLSLDEEVTRLDISGFHTQEGLKRAAILKERGRWTGEGHLRHSQTGELIPTLVSSFLVRNTSGEPQAFATVQRDNREAKQTETRLRQMETLSAMGHLVAGVAHEVRNPIFGMMATLDAMDATRKMTGEQQPFVDALRRELKRMNGLMNDLLEYGRPLDDALRGTPIDLVVDEAIRACMPLAASGSVRIERAMNSTLPQIRTSAPRLTQVFQNVLSNAIQHSPADGVVRVEGSLVNEGGKSSVEIRVVDSGPGFHGSDLLHAFEPFFTRRRGGTGLGLSIVERIVMQHGGDVRAENRPTGGAQVIIRLPAA